jgi:signal peptidase I
MGILVNVPNRGRRKTGNNAITQLYVDNVNGSDNNSGLFQAEAFQKIQTAIEYAALDLDLQGNSLLIRVAQTGIPYTEALALYPHNGYVIVIYGNSIEPGDVVIDPQGTNVAITAYEVVGHYEIRNLKLQNSNNLDYYWDVVDVIESSITLSGVVWGENIDGIQLWATQNASVSIINSSNIIGDAWTHIDLSRNSVCNYNCQLTLEGSRTFDRFATLNTHSTLIFNTPPLVGSASGTRAYVGTNCTLATSTGNQNFIPGNQPAIVAPSGVIGGIFS